MKENRDLEKELDEALKAHASEKKVPISLKLDSDVYLELKKRAKSGEANGKYQRLLINILREYLFEEESLKSRIEKIEKVVFKQAD